MTTLKQKMAQSKKAAGNSAKGVVEIAVIGGGPKAAAIAAKASVLNEQNKASIRVTIFEPHSIGANWAGANGYTNGQQRLCTVAERDVGYPYTTMLDPAVDEAMWIRYSWTSYLHTNPNGYDTGYSGWVDSGRKPPLHCHYADYLRWVVDRAAPAQVEKAVTGLVAKEGKWRLRAQNAKGDAILHPKKFEAVVVTGPGPARELPVVEIGDAKRPKTSMYNGHDFWQRLDQVRARLTEALAKMRLDSDSSIVIVGAGGTGASILSWLVANGARDFPIHIVANQASLYTRVDSVFENRLFTDEDQWKRLSRNSRRTFFDRVNRGVVWASVIDQVSSASKLEMVDGRAQQLEVKLRSDGTTQMELTVSRDDGFSMSLRPVMLIDCSGFDMWWFLRLIEGLPEYEKEHQREIEEGWVDGMSEQLRLAGCPWDDLPALYAAMASREHGPGFASLMVLGAMSDRVLRAHRFDRSAG